MSSRIKNEKKGVSSRVGTAVCDLNDCLRLLGLDVESNFADSTASSLSDALFDDIPLTNPEESASSFAIGLAEMSAESVSLPVCLSSVTERHYPMRNAQPNEDTLKRQLMCADRELKRWLITVQTSTNLADSVCKLYKEELVTALDKFRGVLNKLVEFYAKRGEVNNQRILQQTLKENVVKCDSVWFWGIYLFCAITVQ